jgi:hypothetical protein
MKFHTKRYNVIKVNTEEFNEDIQYEINLKDGYEFEDETHLNYASDFDELKELISQIRKMV